MSTLYQIAEQDILLCVLCYMSILCHIKVKIHRELNYITACELGVEEAALQCFEVMVISRRRRDSVGLC